MLLQVFSCVSHRGGNPTTRQSRVFRKIQPGRHRSSAFLSRAALPALLGPGPRSLGPRTTDNDAITDAAAAMLSRLLILNTVDIPKTTMNICMRLRICPRRLPLFFSVARRETLWLPLEALRFHSSATISDDSIRLSKLISQHGTNISMSRREAERYIRDGDVTVAGEVVTSPHFLVDWRDAASAIKVGGKLLQVQQSPPDTRVWLVHKLSGEVVSERDPQGRPSLLERIQRMGTLFHLKPIGRLDMTTEGLILVTNNGSYARDMELPSNNVHRTYRVRVHGKLSPHKLKAMRCGLTIGNTRYNPMKVQIENTRKRASTNTWLRITCTEGKNRQIRNVLIHLGCECFVLVKRPSCRHCDANVLHRLICQ